MDIRLITYINLPHRQEKNENMLSQLLRCGLPFFRTEGVVPENFGDYPVPEYLKPGSTRHQGTVGCYLAHRRAVGALADRCAGLGLDESGQVLVLEDDVTISEEFWRHIATLSVPNDADLIFFDNSHKNGTTPDPQHLHDREKQLYFVYKGWPEFFGAFAYVIPIGNLRRICQLLDNPPNGVYWDVDGYYIENARSYTYKTNMVRVTCGISDRNPDWIS